MRTIWCGVGVAVCILLLCTSVASAMSGDLTITTKPDGATVSWNGKELGITPLTIPGLPYGEYTIGITKTGYEPLMKTIRIRSPSRTVTALLVRKPGSMEPSSGESMKTDLSPSEDPSSQKISDKTTTKSIDTVEVKFQSIPPGALIRVEGITSGFTTNTTLQVIRGTQMVELTLDGYETYHEEIAFPEESPLIVRLVPLKTTTIMVDTTPPDARVYLDETYKGDGPHLSIGQVTYGEHTLKIQKQGYEPITRTIGVDQENTQFEGDLERKGGIIHVRSIPTGARVTYNAVLVEKTTPVTLHLPEGEYTFTASTEGFPKEIGEITLENGDEKTLEFVLDGPQGEAVHHEDGTITVGVNTVPPGAAISIDGRDQPSKTPALIRLTPGDHTIRLSLENYEPYEEEIAFPEESPLNVYFKEASSDYQVFEGNEPQSDDETIDITFETNPPGAMVTLSAGKRKVSGISPCTLAVTPGTYTLTVSLFGFVDYSNLHTYEIPERNQILMDPFVGDNGGIPAEGGVAYIHSIPEGARVTIEDQDRGVTPLTLTDLDPGTYEATLSLDGYPDITQPVTIIDAYAMYYRGHMDVGLWDVSGVI